MRVLFPLHLFYPSKVGGPANTIYWLCKALVKNGHEITVVATRDGIDGGKVEIDKWVDVDGINVRYCDSTSKFSRDVIRYCWKKLKDVDTVIFSSICFLPNFFIAFSARLQGKKIIWSPRGELFDSAIQKSKGKSFYFELLRAMMGKRIIFHATSEAEKCAIKEWFPKSEVVIIPNYMEIPQKEEVKSNYSKFIFVGRIAPIKAIDKLIKGLSISKLFVPSKYSLQIVGGVESQFEAYYNDLKNQVERLGLKHKVEFVGTLSGKAKYQAYSAARYSFLVSNSENFGNVVIEALSQGTPVVASKGTPWESLLKEHAGFWIDNSPEMIAETVDTLINQSEEEYLSYRANAMRYSQSFSVYDHVEEWEIILKKQ